jgi:DnaJ-class molecular chaperone
MDYKEAFKILNIDLNETDYKDITLDFLKKKYHKQALLNHPDKNGNTIESNEKFKKINEAYDYLKREIGTNSLNEENDDFVNSTSWENILKMFIMSILEGKYTDIFSKIINDILNGYKNISIKLFDDLSKDMTLEVYAFLSKYRSTFNLNEEILEKVKDIVLQKFNNVEVYKLNPSINDLLNNNVYKLYVGEDLFFVPLWHNELYFENLNREIIVFCEPELPENIKIDDDNNIYYEFTIFFNELENLIVNNGKIKFNIGDKTFEIELSLLFIKKEQFYKIKKQGLTKIKENSIYDVSSKSDVIVKITIDTE